MCVLPPLLPNELLQGYVGRIAALNGCGNETEVAKQLSSAVGSDSENAAKATVLTATCAFNRIDLGQLLALHTCHAISSSIGSATHATGRDRRMGHTASKLAVRNPGRRLLFCPKCVAEDRRKYRFSYWRRDHQISGKFACAQHATFLEITPESRWTTFFLEDVPRYKCVAEAKDLSLFVNNRNIGFVLEFLDFMLRANLVIDRVQCTRVVRKALRRTGDDPSKPGWYIEFCKRVEAVFPMAWLRLVFPMKAFFQGHLDTYCMNWITQSGLTIPHTCLAVASSLFFPCPRDALRMF